MPGIRSFSPCVARLAAVIGVLVLLHGCGWLHRPTVRSPSFERQEIGAAYRSGEAAVQNGDYVKGRRVLMQIISQFPGENDLAQVQWLIARSYELEGRSDEAIAEYKRFIRNYPKHPNAEDAEDRIHRLERGPVPAARTPKAPKAKKPVRVLGNLSTDYEYGQQREPLPDTTLNLVSTRLDVQIRNLDDGRGKFVFSGLRTLDLLDRRNDRARIQKLYADWHTTTDTAALRIGRQPGTPGGLSSRYDGAEAHYRLVPALSLDAASGFPVDFLTRGSITTDRYFYEGGFSVVDLYRTTGRVYAVHQFSSGILDRNALGGNVQGAWGKLGVGANVDYDFSFGEFNDRFLSLDYAVTDAWHLMVSQDRRKDPYLQLSNALQDPAAAAQGVTALDEWVTLQGEAAVRAMARNHTIDSTDKRVGLRWTMGTAWSGSTDYSHGVSAIGQADGTRTTRTIDRVSFYLAQYGAWRFPDATSLLAIHQTASDLNTDTLYLTGGKRLGRRTNVQLKGRIESIDFKNGNGSDAVRYVPGFTLSVEPSLSVSLTAEAEYTLEDRLYDATFPSLFARFNLTVTF